MLINTGDAYLIESSDKDHLWGDPSWSEKIGTPPDKPRLGGNQLGWLLMMLRAVIEDKGVSKNYAPFPGDNNGLPIDPAKLNQKHSG
jgi:hypothetical protein